MNCQERHEKCWAKCEKYKAWRREYDAGKRIINKQKNAESALDDLKRKGIKRIKKYQKK